MPSEAVYGMVSKVLGTHLGYVVEAFSFDELGADHDFRRAIDWSVRYPSSRLERPSLEVQSCRS